MSNTISNITAKTLKKKSNKTISLWIKKYAWAHFLKYLEDFLKAGSNFGRNFLQLLFLQSKKENHTSKHNMFKLYAHPLNIQGFRTNIQQMHNDFISNFWKSCAQVFFIINYWSDFILNQLNQLIALLSD